MGVAHAIIHAFRAVAGTVVQHIPENLVQLGIVLGTRGLALSALTGASAIAICEGSDICEAILGQGGDLAVDVLTTGLGLAAAAAWHHFSPQFEHIVAAASLVLAALHLGRGQAEPAPPTPVGPGG